jgi:hypothetical protein
MTRQSVLLLAAALAALVLGGCASKEYAPGKDLPYMIISEEPWEELKSLSDGVGEIYDLYGALFQLDARELPQLWIKVESGAGRPPGWVDEYPAFYRTDPPRIRFLWPPDRSLLLHEIGHHFIMARVEEPLPVCINEGLAAYLGWSAFGEDGLLLGEVAVEHSRTVRAAALQGGLIPLRELMTMPPQRFYDSEHRMLHYGQAWAFVRYVLHSCLPQNKPFHLKVDWLAKLTPDAAAAMEPAFVDFWRNFSVRDLLVSQLEDRSVIRCQSAAFRLGLLQDPSAADALLRVARDARRPVSLREVSLLAASVIFLGPGGHSVRVPYRSALRDLEQDGTETMRSLASDLAAAVAAGDAGAIQSRFGAAGCDSPFYPAGSFKVSRE